MAGIGFELRKLLRRDNFFGLLRAYGYAGIISSGPWILSILGVMGIGIISVGVVLPPERIKQFLVSVTYMMAGSLILTGFLQLMFTRYVADRHFAKEKHLVVPNLFGALFLTTVASGFIGAVAVIVLFEWGLLYRVLMVGTFVVLSDMWIVVVLLSGLRDYRRVLRVFFIGYSVAAGTGLLLRPYGLEGLLGGFFLGHATLLFSMLALVIRDYRDAPSLLSFDFLRPRRAFYSLLFAGFFYNLGIWADKFIFWANPITSEQVLGPLRASLIYDLPIFLAYLSIVPGMAVFLVRIETDFAEHYDRFYAAVREGDTLGHITHLKNGMIFHVRQGIYEIFKVQGITILFLLLAGNRLFAAIGFSPLYLQLFFVDLVGVGVQVLLLSILNVMFYLDQRHLALALTVQFFVLNTGITILTQWLGPAFFGYGFAGATVITSFTGLVLLARKVDRLEYETFMLQA